MHKDGQINVGSTLHQHTMFRDSNVYVEIFNWFPLAAKLVLVDFYAKRTDTVYLATTFVEYAVISTLHRIPVRGIQNARETTRACRKPH